MPKSAIHLDGGIDMIAPLEALAQKILELTAPDHARLAQGAG